MSTAFDVRRRHLLGLAVGVAALAGCAVPVHRPPVASSVEVVPERPLRRVAFGSCVDPARPQAVWGQVQRERPDLMIFGGDNVYASEQPWSRERLDAAYARQAAVPEFAALRQAVPHLAIWDDHDYGVNDGGADFAHKAASKDAFLRFWKVPAEDTRQHREGLYHAQVYGPPGQRVQVIVLDTRWFRSPLKASDERGKPGKERYLADTDPAKTLLGAAQWDWLEQQLREPADLRLVYSSIQIVADGHGWERWGNLPRERERLYRLIERTGAQGVVFLSGDRHAGALYRQADGTPYPFYELTSSGITHAWQGAAEEGPNRLGPLVGELNYGLVEIDWAARAVQLSLKNAQGRTQQKQSIPFNALQSRS